jgi:hypothetical protein
VFRAEIDGKILTMNLEGLNGLNFFMSDNQTHSMWQQATGLAFDGPMKGKRLAMVNFLLTNWSEWRKLHPDTLALTPDPVFLEKGKAFFAGLGRGGTPPEGRGRGAPQMYLGRPLRSDSRLAEREQVVGLEIGDAHKAYPIALLRQQSVVNDQVGNLPVLLAHSSANNTTTAFVRKLRGRTLTFEAAELGALLDKETRSKWNMYGECTSGQLKGAKLEKLTALPSFWFSWAQFFPDTAVFSVQPTNSREVSR